MWVTRSLRRVIHISISPLNPFDYAEGARFLQKNICIILFNADLSRGKCQSHPEDVRRLWTALDGRQRFPLGELVPAQTTVGGLL